MNSATSPALLASDQYAKPRLPGRSGRSNSPNVSRYVKIGAHGRPFQNGSRMNFDFHCIFKRFRPVLVSVFVAVFCTLQIGDG